MTLKDWEELMEVIGDKIDVLAFGHQGRLGVATKGKYGTEGEQIRPMKLRLLGGGSKSALRKTWVLDANDSVAEQCCYSIRWDGEEIKPEMIMLGVPDVPSPVKP